MPFSKESSGSFPGENARGWGALGEARPGQSSLSAGALRYRAWAQSWSSAALVQALVVTSGYLADPVPPSLASVWLHRWDFPIPPGPAFSFPPFFPRGC